MDTLSVSVCINKFEKNGRAVAEDFCMRPEINATLLPGGTHGAGVRESFFAIAVADAQWAKITWQLECVESEFDVVRIHDRLSNCQTFQAYYDTMKRFSDDYGLPFFGGRNMHSSGNCKFWHGLRNDVADRASAAGRVVVWPLPRALADIVWKA